MTRVFEPKVATLEIRLRMARPRSEDKRIALLEAATEEVATHGLGAPTVRIAKLAGVAEGTLFRYFPTKDDLLNELYLHIKQKMCDALAKKYVADAPLRYRAQALWDGYIDWGLANPEANKAVNQLTASGVVTQDTRDKGIALFPETGIATGFAANAAFVNLPAAFADALFLALASTTMEFAARDSQNAETYKASGFLALWSMYGNP